MNANECPVCKTVTIGMVKGSNPYLANCPRCGPFHILGDLSWRQISALGEHEQLALMQVLDDADQEPVLTEGSLLNLHSTRLRSLPDRADRLLREIIKTYPKVGQNFDAVNPTHYGLMRPVLARNGQELNFFLQYIRELDWLKYHSSGLYSVTPKGWMRSEEAGPSAESKQAFIAMWFDETMKNVWVDGFKPAIEAAGWFPLRIDAKEHINKICDEIILEVRRSRFVVADLTGARGGVYYEAGFASGLGIPVFLTCKDGESLHFDVRQYNCIFWTDAADLKAKLTKSIGRVLGQGPLI